MYDYTPLTPWDHTMRLDTLNTPVTMDMAPYADRWIAISHGMVLAAGDDLGELTELLDDVEGLVEYHFISADMLEAGRGKCVPLS